MSHLFQYEFKSVSVPSKSRPFFKSHSIPANSSEENTSRRVISFLFLSYLGLGICSLGGPSGTDSVLITSFVYSPTTSCCLLFILVRYWFLKRTHRQIDPKKLIRRFTPGIFAAQELYWHLMRDRLLCLILLRSEVSRLYQNIILAF